MPPAGRRAQDADVSGFIMKSVSFMHTCEWPIVFNQLLHLKCLLPLFFFCVTSTESVSNSRVSGHNCGRYFWGYSTRDIMIGRLSLF